MNSSSSMYCLNPFMMTVMSSHLPSATLLEEKMALPYITAWRGKRKVLHQIRSTANETFAQISPFLDALVQAMPGSISRLEDEGEGRFLCCFTCLSACKEAFAGCLPLISFDACSIKNDFKGIVLAACSGMETEKLCHLLYLSLQLKMPKIGIGVKCLKNSIPAINDLFQLSQQQICRLIPSEIVKGLSHISESEQNDLSCLLFQVFARSNAVDRTGQRRRPWYFCCGKRHV
jgi:hypothetical protein